MDLLDEGLFSFRRIRNLLSNGAISDRPIEVSILQGILIFAEIHHFELIFDASDVDRVGRMCSSRVDLIN